VAWHLMTLTIPFSLTEVPPGSIKSMMRTMYHFILVVHQMLNKDKMIHRAHRALYGTPVSC